MAIAHLDGRRFRQAVVAGADWVRHRREYINRINVFPVADGDTGTNLALSLSATAAAVRDVEDDHLGRVASLAAEACTLGAKGNSGVIFAHWFLGMSAAIGERERLVADEVVFCLEAATERVYGAMEEPVEGTIITVMRAVSAGTRRLCGRDQDLGTLLENMVRIGAEALARTPEQLAVLKSAHVVDAGAQGYVDFLEGAARALRGEAMPESVHEEDVGTAGHPEDLDGDLRDRFCTEVVVRGRRFDSDRLRSTFRPTGSSLLVACTAEVFKLHVHTNHPDEVIRLASRLGEVLESKVDDMWRQREERHTGVDAPIIALEQQSACVAVLCDSTADLPKSVRERYGIEMAPLQVLFGDQVYRDQVDLSTEDFYRELEHNSHHPSTSQPPPREFVQALDKVRSDREAVIVTISAALSGTYRSAQSGARLAEHPRVEVFDSGSVSMGAGMMALNAARLARIDAGIDEILQWLERWRADTGVLFTVATLEYLRRGGRIGTAQSLIGNLLGVRPILGFEGGEIVPLGKVRGEEEAFQRVLEEFRQRVPESARVRLGLIEIGDCDQVDRLEAEIRSRCQVVETVRAAPTGVVGAHAGPGTWGVFFQRVREDDPLL
jgi:DAK2 domain fusion protein YloV